jgi:hypothetical protein
MDDFLTLVFLVDWKLEKVPHREWSGAQGRGGGVGRAWGAAGAAERLNTQTSTDLNKTYGVWRRRLVRVCRAIDIGWADRFDFVLLRAGFWRKKPPGR